MRAYKEVLIQSNELDDVFCNICGEKIEKDAFGYRQDHVSIEKQWGFGSPHDGETHNIDICQACFEKLVARMKISPLVQQNKC